MTLSDLNTLEKSLLKEELTKCCGAHVWVEKMMAIFPVSSKDALLNEARNVWYDCNEDDWKEAFTHHPKIGDMKSLKEKFTTTSKWAEGEQASVKQTSTEVLEALAEGNKLYEDKFGYIFIVCATGKSAEEMLVLLKARLPNDPHEEIKIAMEEQNKITQLRLQKLLSS
ncbi:2-oxo-4-hydroxy-4-carboxy-5-ureidoimidazoline decarboxylase [Segetibacter aerophilus]|uniref:2-oxo-4-hydroxy-4-carboxy-5-ureidoimidazoline decarboxylase n=1 Tax=Segetibacter aerophilus TaxID=670293 RepID=A0A512BAJ7_9BACT|nr:2-oxo-4-hydroxy-4-carboxy-5-ureidoimidazoline decarboxylase [Segetibacter aerophilus]GEO08986.1 2-oxo-4-hydroxy-4-carboxy-5-ureidoimidazoline decarboxylase [Segetibacter aerophilus]